MSDQSHSPTDKLRGIVEALASAGYTQQKIAERLDINPNTLRKHYRKELDHGKMDRVANVMEKLYSIAMFDGKPTTAQTTACIFYLKCRGPKGEWMDSNTNATENEMKEISKIQIQVVGENGQEITKKSKADSEEDTKLQ